MRIIVLNSGSNGNAVYVESAATGTGVLLDCGLTRKQIETRLKVHGRYPSNIRAIFVTHEHADHIRGVPGLTRVYHMPVHLTEQTYRNYWRKDMVKGHRFMAIGEPVAIGDVTVEAYPKSHDAADAVFFVVRAGGKSFLYVTDLGVHNEQLTAMMPDADGMLLESNYDADMLRNGSYPEFLKQRIMSDIGHLSNKDARRLLEKHADGRLRLLILGHLSEHNNTPELVAAEMDALLDRKEGFRPLVHIASRHDVSEVFEL
jgi:phosphoribosyl 1,2-cyclic phosphodiesterase